MNKMKRNIEELFDEKTEEEKCHELIKEFSKSIWRVYYPTRNVLLWASSRRTRMGWITEPITRRIYEAVINGKYIQKWEDTKLLSPLFKNDSEVKAMSAEGDQLVSREEAKEFAKRFVEIDDCRWRLFSGWAKFWVGDNLKPGERLFIHEGDPNESVRKMAKLMSPN